MREWLLELPLFWMGFAIFLATFLVAALVYWSVVRLTRNETNAVAFKAVSPGMLPPLGIIFGLLIGFTAAQVWGDFDRAKLAVANEASGLRSVLLLATAFPPEQASRLRTLIGRHIEHAINEEWHAMAEHHATFAMRPTMLMEALQATLTLKPADDGQRAAQREILASLEKALEARRQRLVLSGSAVSGIKWGGLLLQALITLIAIAMVHSGNRRTCAIALGLFASGIALSVLMIAAYSQPFTGELSVSPELLEHVLETIPK
jgi:hypothetical protein